MSSLLFLSLLVACTSLISVPSTPPPAPTPPPLADELIFYDWENDIPEAVLAAFSEEYSVKVTYLTYDSQEEAQANVQAGQIYDLVVLDNDAIPPLLANGKLAQIDYQNVPNFDHIAPNFRDLAYDPANKYSVPFNWGTTGLVVRNDLIEEPINRWTDLWDQRYAGKIAVRQEPRELIALMLKSLDYSINSENPVELEAALTRLLEFREHVLFVDPDAEGAVPLLASGEVAILVGWAEDVLAGRAENLDISYILPEEGPFLWGDNFVIPASSTHKYTAELLLNFILRPEISAQITNANYYATANEAARSFVEPEILNDPIIFPPNTDLKAGEVYLPLSVEGEKLYQDIWERFITEEQ